MEKTAYVGSKAWGGELRPVPENMMDGLRQFCKEYNWTGGGELEYIEDVEGAWHAIDWNPRFPAWIFGGCYAGVNLPAALVQHALHKQSGGAVPFPTDVVEASETAVGGFTRTAVEIPRRNCSFHAQDGWNLFGANQAGKGGGAPSNAKSKMPQLPPGIKLGPLFEGRASPAAHVEEGAGAAAESADGGGDDAVRAEATEETAGDEAEVSEDPMEALPDLKARKQLTLELNRLLPANTSDVSTPRFMLSRATVRDQLISHKEAIERALAQLTNPPALKMCLSVKTQPHPVVLAEARDAGYLGEVITSAEMHACLDAGWAPNEIVMNGPGKWYGDVSGPRSTETKPASALRCLFADSVVDLKTIVDRLLDPTDWLQAEIVGVRFSPVWVSNSRFGLDCKDPRVLAKAAEQLKRLPSCIKIGVHMHFAASKLGVEQWFGMAKGYVKVAINFEQLLETQLSVMDFGGGWPSHLLDSSHVQPYLVDLLSEVQKAFPTLEAIQFEPGKAITERAGGVLTKVLEIREMEKKTPDGDHDSKHNTVEDASDSENDSSDGEEYDDGIPEVWRVEEDGSDFDDNGSDNGSDGGRRRKKKTKKSDRQYHAVVVDACISDFGSMPVHVHPLVWQHHETGEWTAMKPGKDAMWGSICMEFDILGQNFRIPKGAQVGDHVLIAFTGAYDTTMAYEFADGKERSHLLLE